MTNYIYLLYGTGDDCYIEAAYSIGTLRRRLDAAASRIIVFTDQPEKVKDWPVECDSIAGEFEVMRAKNGYIHRAKLCVLLRCLEKYPGNVVFLDSDTSVRGDIVALAGRLSPSTAILYAFESQNPEIGLSGFHTTLAGGIPYRFTSASRMYNSGVVGLHRDDQAVVSRSLELCDAILDFGASIHTTEQFSLGEALRISNFTILEARGVVVHYIQHKFYIRKQIYDMMRATGRQPWQFEKPVAYSRWKVYWLRKFGYYQNPRDQLK